MKLYRDDSGNVFYRDPGGPWEVYDWEPRPWSCEVVRVTGVYRDGLSRVDQHGLDLAAAEADRGPVPTLLGGLAVAAVVIKAARDTGLL